MIILAALFIAFLSWKAWRNYQVSKQIPDLLKEGAIVVDVRSRGEFAGGSVKNSINIPLDELEKKYSSLDKDKTIILVCASGGRSGQAMQFLKSKGFTNLFNGGSWAVVKMHVL